MGLYWLLWIPCLHQTITSISASCVRPDNTHCLHGNITCNADDVPEKCTDGCTYTGDTQVWWVGPLCNVSLDRMHFGGSDKVDTTPVGVSDSYVIWQWQEGRHVPLAGEDHVGYNIYYRLAGVDDDSWKIGTNVSYTTDTWLTGKVNNLQPDTEYEFNIAVYRKWTDGRIVESSNRAYPETIEKRMIAKTSISTVTTKTQRPTTGLIVTESQRLTSLIQTTSFMPSARETVKTTTVDPTSTQRASQSTRDDLTVVQSTTGRASTSTVAPLSTGAKNISESTTSSSSTAKHPTTLNQTTEAISASDKASVTSPRQTDNTPGLTIKGTPLPPQPVEHTPAYEIWIGTAFAVLLVLTQVVATVILYKRGTFRGLLSKDAKTKHQDDENGNLKAKTEVNSSPKEGDEYVPIVLTSANETTQPPVVAVKPRIAPKPVSVDELGNHIQQNQEADGKLFKTEFDSIPKGQIKTWAVGASPDNKTMNRYKNVYAFDDTRVELKTNDSSIETDYINANYVQGFGSEEKKYIATQGPTKLTISYFWAMVWQTSSNIVVMLTKTYEGGNKKCDYYWPVKAGQEETYGDFTVTNMSTENYSNYTMRELQIRHETEQRTVYQLHFLQWPDKSIPDDAFPLLTFRNKVKSLEKVSTGPLIVHCSAGIGRTGTYIAIDQLIQQAESEKVVNAGAIVSGLRRQRINMVQTYPQYEFLYEAVYNAVTCGKTSMSVPEFINKLQEMRSDDAGDSKIAKEFQILNSFRPELEGTGLHGLRPENEKKNKDKSIIPSNMSRAILMTEYDEGNDYINAVCLENYRPEKPLTATQMPLSDTVVDFWRLVHDYKPETIIMLDVPDDESPVYWPEEKTTETYGPLLVTLVSHDDSTSLHKRTFEIGLVDKETDEESWIVDHYNPTDWEAELPTLGCMSQLLDILEDASNDLSVIIQCRDGASRCGLVCVCSYLIESIKVDQEVDVFMATRHMHGRRPQFIPTKEQYEFIYTVAHDRLVNTQTYVNT